MLISTDTVFISENVFPELARELKLKPDWDYKDMYLAILEELAVTFKISRYRVYKADELAREIHKSLLKADGRLPLAGEDPAGVRPRPPTTTKYFFDKRPVFM